MDIQHLVDRLEDLIDEGRHMPFSRFTMVDEERALELIDQMRISIPEEIEKANRILTQRDRVLAQANEEAARLLQQARAKGEEMLEQDINVQAAQNRAANIIEESRQEAQRIRDEADGYVLDVLSRLEQILQKNMNTVRNGINALKDTVDASTPALDSPISPLLDEVEDARASFPTIHHREEVPVDSDSAKRRGFGISLKRADEVEE